MSFGPHGVPPPLAREARRSVGATPQRQQLQGGTTMHAGGVVVTRHTDVSSSPRATPLQGRLEIAQPNLVSSTALRDHLAQSLGLSPQDIDVRPSTSAVAAVEFSVMNARHVYPDDAAVARALSSDTRLRMNLNKLLRVHSAGTFTFVLREPHVSDRAWGNITASNLFNLVDAGLLAAVEACTSNGSRAESVPDALDSAIRVAFAEAVAPHEVRALRYELDRAVAKVADMRIELTDLERRNDTADLQRELDREIANRRNVERRYQELVEAESAWKEQAARLDREANAARPELRRLREMLAQLEAENTKLEKAKKQKEDEVAAMRQDSAANVDRLVAHLDEAERELHLWRQRCDALQQEKELARRSYQTNEEAMKLRLTRLERQLFEAGQGRAVVDAALRATSTLSAGSQRDRSSSPRSRSSRSGDDANSTPTISTSDARVKRLAVARGSSSVDELHALKRKLESTEASLRERTIQLAQAMGVSARGTPLVHQQ